MDMKAVTVEGHVEQRLVSPGSKSERAAIVLITPSGQTYVLRRQGGPAFVDLDLAPLVGHSIRAEGLNASGTLIMKRWEKID
jgi:hypothetical protein